MNKKTEEFGQGVLTEQEIMEQGYYSSTPNTPKPQSQKSRKTVNRPRVAKSKVQRKTTIKTGDKGNKAPSFPHEEVKRITLEVPFELVRQLKTLAANKDSRFNLEVANAFKLYLKQSSVR